MPAWLVWVIVCAVLLGLFWLALMVLDEKADIDALERQIRGEDGE